MAESIAGFRHEKNENIAYIFYDLSSHRSACPGCWLNQ
jgi:hypothetical protein